MRDGLDQLALAIRDAAVARVRTAATGIFRGLANRGRVLVDAAVTETTTAAGVASEGPVPRFAAQRLHLGGAGFALTFGLRDGDPLLVVHRTRDHGAVDRAMAAGATPGPTQPTASDRMGWSGGVAVPLRPVARERADGGALAWLEQGAHLEVGDTPAPYPLSRADRVDAQLNQIRSLLTGWTVAPNDGGLALKTAALVLWPPSPPQPSTASARLKVDA